MHFNERFIRTSFNIKHSTDSLQADFTAICMLIFFIGKTKLLCSCMGYCKWAVPRGNCCQKLAFDHDGDAEAGSKVRMQYSGQIWEGQIVSLHGKCTKFCVC